MDKRGEERGEERRGEERKGKIKKQEERKDGDLIQQAPARPSAHQTIDQTAELGLREHTTTHKLAHMHTLNKEQIKSNKHRYSHSQS